MDFSYIFLSIISILWVIISSVWCLRPELVETLIILIPKGENLVHLKNLSPISLCNVVYKFITKVLMNRLRPFFKFDY